jgi:Leucine-rich repeat (LRR) protein
MTLLSSPLPKQYPCDFCSHQPIVFNNVSEFCVLKGLWANSNNQTSLEENLRWMSTAQYCDWIGVTCNANLSIIGLEILPPHTPLTLLFGIGLLSNLQNLNIAGDGIIPRGTIPDNLLQLGSLVNLRFASTGLIGPIPDTFDKMTSLENLEFLSNKNLGTEIPPSIGLLPSLKTLTMSQQGLAGPIPDFIGQSKTLQANLRSLNLNVNNLTGNIPISLTQLTALQSLSLKLNKLSGDIPDTLAQSKFKNTLISLDLSGNAFQNQIPDSLSNITELVALVLQANQLTGKIPESLAKLPKLSDLSLSSNQLSGGIPDIIGSINLAKFELKNNTLLTGVVPVSVCQREYSRCDLTLTGLTSPVNCVDCSLPQPIIPPTTTTAAITTPVPTA